MYFLCLPSFREPFVMAELKSDDALISTWPWKIAGANMQSVTNVHVRHFCTRSEKWMAVQQMLEKKDAVVYTNEQPNDAVNLCVTLDGKSGKGCFFVQTEYVDRKLFGLSDKLTLVN